MAREYRNFDVHLFAYQRDGAERCRVRVEKSPAGEETIEEGNSAVFPIDLRARLIKLEKRELKYPEIVSLGTDIGKLLFAGSVLDKLRASWPRDANDPRLRIRIKCDGEIALEAIPWEYAYLPHLAIGPGQPTGFLVLSSDASLVRYQLMKYGSSSLQPLLGRKLGLLAAMSSPTSEKYPKLDLAPERRNIEAALGKVERIEQSALLERATMRAFNDALSTKACDILHFAGHGDWCAPPQQPTEPAQGHLIFEKDDGSEEYYPSSILAVDLRNRDVRLVVLSACNSGRSKGENVWAGIAPALVQAGVPAVVGMQFGIYDDAAIEFGRTFYQQLANGKAIDEAVTEGRKAILRTMGCDTCVREFGVPLLYLRCNEGGDDAVLFPDDAARSLASPPTASAASPALVLRQIAELGEYKTLHEAMDKSRMGGLNIMREKVKQFPTSATTVAEFRSYLSNFRIHSRTIEAVTSRKLCEPNLVTALQQEFSAVLDDLDDAIKQRDGARMPDVIGDLESLIANYSSKVNIRLTSVAGGLNLDALVQMLTNAAPATQRALALAALAELSKLSRELKEKVELHNAYQIIDDKLALIRRNDSNRYKELVKHWNILSNRIIQLDAAWLDQSGLREVVESLDQAMIEKDEARAQKEFSDFCSIVQTGFSAIDTDLLRICKDVHAKAEKSIADIPVH